MGSTFVIADDHPLFRDAMNGAILSFTADAVIHTVGALEDLQAFLRKNDNIDLVLLDLSMPGASGFSGLIAIRGEFPEVPVAVVSASENASTIRKCLSLGASAFIPKSSGSEFIQQGIEAVQSGEIWVPPNVDLDGDEEDEISETIARIRSLTPQQMRVLTMVSEGLLNKQIAYELSVSEATVKAHVSAVLLKLGVDSRTQAVIMLNRIGDHPEGMAHQI